MPRTSNSSSVCPDPSTTASSGRAATRIGIPVSWARRWARPFRRAPPPASMMPRSMTSAASSGGVLSSVTFTASTMLDTGSSSASRIS